MLFSMKFKKKNTKELVGVSYWRTKTTTNTRVRIIAQGKLRIHKDYRRLGLHTQAGFFYYIRSQLRHPLTRFYFLTIASLFNFVSMRKTVGEYYILNKDHTPATARSLAPVYSILDDLIEEDKFTIDPETKAINVYVTIRESVIAEFPESYFSQNEVQEYIKINPKWRQAHDIAYCYPFSFRNVLYLLFRIIDQSYIRFFKSKLKLLLK
eukprot:TRINITY_DN5369_c0_g1_i2.p1 TRINITY_DN5369_c0_g1~~TRINITY_DN5369_c0_g1_i2.p1  ORF type:complete len:209 (-),score=30.16 TRINITY_DN5369_c0_g1_i2:6-632(-)